MGFHEPKSTRDRPLTVSRAVVGFRMRIGRLRLSKTIQAALWMGAGGASLAAANLVLAGVLSPADFGRLSLVEAILSLCSGMGPFGFDSLAARRELRPRWSDFGLGVTASLMVGGAAVILAGVGYHLQGRLLALIFVGSGAGALATVGAGFEQALVRVNRAQAVLQSTFVVFALGSLLMLTLGVGSWTTAAAILVLGYVIAGSSGTLLFAREAGRLDEKAFVTTDLRASQKWKQGTILLLIAGSTHLLHQAERLVIPSTLTLADLGTFTVAWTIVGSPFKLLQSGIAFATLPRLRNASGPSERWKIILGEVKLVGILGIVGGAILFLLSISIIEKLYGTKYPIGLGLVTILIAVGVIRALYGIAHASVVGLGGGRALGEYTLYGWLTTGVGIAAAVALSSWGLAGVILGVAFGWAARIPLAMKVVMPSLKGNGERDVAT